MSETETEPIAVRVESAARLVGVSRTVGYQKVANGEWPSLKVGRARRVLLRGLREWAEGNAKEAGQAARPR